mgnify:CR=1 FL=1
MKNTTTITTTQKIVNKINSKKEFTFIKNKSIEPKNYIVSVQNIYTGKNPSLFFNMNLEINKILSNDIYDSIGLWLDKETSLYVVDANVHFYTLETAKHIARKYDQKAVYDINKNECIFI